MLLTPKGEGLKLYIGTRTFNPAGYLTVDIDPAYKPDIVADATNLSSLRSNSVDEVWASHVLEHIAWPRAFSALSEWARLLKIGGILKLAVPDLRLICSMVARGVNAQQGINLLYGVDSVQSAFESHVYGYTREMLGEMLHVLGFGEFDWWNSSMSDASNGLYFAESNDVLGISINISAKKLRDPLLDTQKLAQRLSEHRKDAFMTVVRNLTAESDTLPPDLELSALLFQHVHYQLIAERERNNYLPLRLLRQLRSRMRNFLQR